MKEPRRLGVCHSHSLEIEIFIGCDYDKERKEKKCNTNNIVDIVRISPFQWFVDIY